MSSHHLYPPFPSDVPTAPLLSISLSSLRTPAESSRFFSACQDLGFFYLALDDALGQSIIAEAEELQLLQEKFYALPHEEKDQYGRDKVDGFYSYRWTGCDATDVWGRPGRREMYNIRADDVTGLRDPLPRHPMIPSDLLASFSRHCREVVDLLLSLLETHLSLPPGSLLDLHSQSVPSGDFVSLQHRAHAPFDEEMVRKGEHTDFGSVTMLFNWLGGLQIRNASGEWVYVKPVPGACVINLADSLVKLTGGLVKSNIHRVAPAPGEQGGLPRYSLVYFAHPNDHVPLKPIQGEFNEEVINAADWVTRRSLGDLRGVYTFKGGVELRNNNDAVAAKSA